MAYTYDDFLSAANAAQMLDKFSQQDLDTARKNPEFGLSLLGLKQDYAKATTEEQRLLANEAANQLRKSYGGYTAGTDGMGYEAQPVAQPTTQPTTQQTVEEKLTNYPSFEFSNEDAYQKLLSEVANQGSFTYDPKTDPAVETYQKMYAREGARASENALAQAAAMTGGRASSYAQSAAQQAGNYYAGQMADMMPTLEQNAYDRFLAEQNAKYAQLEAMRAARNDDMEAWAAEYEMLQNGYNSVYGTETGGSGGGSGGSSAGDEASGDAGTVTAYGMTYNEADLQADVAYAKSLYPSGEITDIMLWKELKSVYPEEVLKARGLSYKTAAQKKPELWEKVLD